MAPSRRQTVASDIRRFLEQQRPAAFCDACLALRFDVSLEDARAVARMLADGPGFVRRERNCDTCMRKVDATSRGAVDRR
jgi:hypothetical protein